jgi:hypothetical protein
MNDGKILYDVECYPNYFCVGFKSLTTNKTTLFEISEEQNDIHKIYHYFSNYNGFLISFNGIHYDNMLIKYIICNYQQLKHLDYLQITKRLKTFSDEVIEGEYTRLIKSIKYFKVNWTDIDLFLYWSKMLRISKKISLKSLGIQLGYPVVQELPYKPDTILTKEDLPKLRHYNTVHDLGILEYLLKEQDSEIRLRSDIYNEYGLNCWSWDAPKIASEILLKSYCQETNSDLNTIRKLRFEKPTLYLGSILGDFNIEFKLPVFQKLYQNILNSTNGFKEDIIVDYKNTLLQLSYGIGGLHSVNLNETYETSADFQLITSDFTSLYPNLIINYKTIRFEEVLRKYETTKSERIEAKRAKNKSKDKLLKLVLNSVSGLLDNEHSWLYYPEGAMRLRIIGQLILTRCIEVCVINGWQVVSANTDGIEVLVPKAQLPNYKKLLEMAISKFNLQLEHENYQKIVYKNVNNYVALVEKSNPKRKGFFKLDFDETGRREIPLGDSCDELVISKALNAFYTKDIKPEEFISNPDKYDLHIYDYCKSNKISKNYTVFWNNEVQQNLNRYYFVKNGPYLYKKKDTKTTLEHINVGEGVELFNNYVEKPWSEYNINYSYYISKTNKIISEINNNYQLKLF